MYNVVLRIDGRRCVHDGVRKTINGSSSYDIILKNISSFIKSRVGQYYVRGTFTNKNLDFSLDVLELNDLGFGQISIEPVVLDSAHPLAIREEHLPQVFEQYDALSLEYLRRRREGKDFNFFHFNVDLINSICETKRLKGCGAACEYVAVAPNGSIYPCHQFDGEEEYRMGSVLDLELNRDIIEQFDQASVNEKEDCAGCWAKYYCSGGCNAANIKYGGGIKSPSRLSCEIMKKRLECAIAINAIENGEV